jgi:hypothetical protein
MADQSVDLEKILYKVRNSIYNHWQKKVEIALASDYYAGRQYKIEDVNELNLKGKTPLTFNYVAKVVNSALGIFADLKFTEKFLPKNPQSIELSDVATEVVRTIYQDNNIELTFQDILKDILLFGEGFLKVWVDTTEDPNGRIVISRLKPMLVFWDPDSLAPDWSDCQFVFEVMYVDKDTLKQLFPDKEEEIELVGATQSPFLFEQPLPFALTIRNVYGDYTAFGGTILSQPIIKGFDKVEVIRFQYKTFENKYFIYDNEDKQYYEVPKASRKEIEAYLDRLNSEFPGKFSLKREAIKKIKVITFIPSTRTILEEVSDPYGIYMFDIIPFWGYINEEERFGLFRVIKDPQDEINLRKSLIVDLLKESPKNKFFIPKTAYTDEEELQELEKRLDDEDISFIPVNVVQGFPTPANTDAAQKISLILQMELRSELQLKDLSNMTDALFGIVPRKIQSGHAIARLQEASIQFLKTFVERFKFGRKLLANYVFELAKVVLPNNYLLRITKNVLGEENFQRINVKLGEFNLLQLLNTKFDVVVEMNDYSPTLRTEMLAKFVRLAELGYPIPPELLLEYMDLPSDLRVKFLQNMANIQQQNQKEGE